MSADKNPRRTFIERKREEIAFLSDFTAVPRKTQSPLSSWPDYAIKKILARDVSHRRSGAFYSESQLRSKTELSLHGFKFKYVYQRLDLICKSEANTLYPLLKGISRPQRLQFTRSAQASLSVLLNVCANIFSRKDIHLLTSLYWETAEFLQQEGWSSSKENPQVAILDSSCFSPSQFGKISVPSSVKIVIVDTTCWTLWDIQRQQLKPLLRRGLSVVLVRSHLKLDCLATEWNRLGSVAFLPSGRFGEEFWIEFLNYARFYSLWSDPAAVYPFLRHKKFKSLTVDWIRGVRESQTIVRRHLESIRTKFIFTFFDHGLYFWVGYGGAEKAEDDKVMNKLVQIFDYYKVAYAVLPSYPWDIVSVTRFRPSHSEFSFPINTNTVIRISIPDLTDKERTKILSALSAWIGVCERGSYLQT